MMDQTASIKEAIENLATKRDQVLTKEAVNASQRMHQNIGVSPSDIGQYKRNLNTVAAFSDSVYLLTSIFRESRFDELSLFISKPRQMIMYQFVLGIARGLGFCVAIIIFAIIYASIA